jgi:light-regulated signal transduction histidine kinase (bacteriophytochrome)
MLWLDGIDSPVFSTDCLAEIYPPAAAYPDVVSGMLAITMARSSRDYVLWFRAEHETTVRWAGDPNKPVVLGEHGARLTPRGSFAQWRVLNRFHAIPWSEVDVEAAEALRTNLLENALQSADRALRDRELAYQRQSLLLAELDHRVRTALGKVEAMVTTAATTPVSMQAFATVLRHRIQAMTQTHVLLAAGKWVGTSLRKLLEADVMPTAGAQLGRISLHGDDIFLSPLEALAMSMVFHELLTNALEHGALSTERGQVAIEWNRNVADDELAIRWQEIGGAPVTVPTEPAGGLDLIQKTIKEDLHGNVDLEWARDGLCCKVRLRIGDTSLR